MKINVRENRRDNQEWTIQRHWKSWTHKTQDEDKQSKKNPQYTTQKTKKMSNTDPTQNLGWTQVLAKDKQFLPLIRHPPCYSHSQDMLEIWFKYSKIIILIVHLYVLLGFWALYYFMTDTKLLKESPSICMGKSDAKFSTRTGLIWVSDVLKMTLSL